MSYSFKGPITAADNARAQQLFKRRAYGFKQQLPYAMAMIVPMVAFAVLDLPLAAFVTFVVGLFVGIFGLFFYQHRSHSQAIRKAGQASEAHGITTTTLTAEGIRIESDLSRAKLSWSLVTDILVDEEMIVLIMTLNMAVLPLRDLRQAAEPQHILHAIGAWRAGA